MRLTPKTSGLARARSRRRVLVTLAAAAIAAALAIGFMAVNNAVNRPELRVRGIPSSGVLNAAALSKAPLTVDTVGRNDDEALANEALRNAEVRLNGEIVPTVWVGSHRVLDVRALRDGEYELTVTADPGLLSREITLSRRFVVDTNQS
ncbi:hypothetical protein IM697_21820 [Streptomyces ferrugineus]|uniref:Uncharacterized protein n=1 Tax=Streptomyces ferrugineus TaxID=1413221 RepID=A0A7M2SYT0_9ACTN|nr:hypothetical protein [Streptomyces ferrugineus]QOV40795.1 hypothetical protein IM697_21820 [Streptomyces ferrugineus]